MKHLIMASAFALAAATTVSAQTPPPKAPSAAPTKLSQAECDSLWNQANPSNAATISESQAQAFVTDVKKANPDNDGTLDKNEFSKACGMGLVKGSASTGASSGSSGSSSSGSDKY